MSRTALPWLLFLAATAVVAQDGALSVDPGVGVAAAGTATTEGPVEDGSENPADRDLDAIHDDLVELRFEKALSSLETLLGEPGLTERQRVEGLVLRSQTHVAFGDLKAAEQDYREILALRPAYAPDVSLTPSKAIERFEKIQAQLVGRLAVRVDPADGRLSVDGREVQPDVDGTVPLLAGGHLLRIELDGHDPVEQQLVIEPNQRLDLELQLIPNARTVVLRTEPEGIEIHVDGIPVGRTTRPDAGDRRAPAELTLKNLALGEHSFGFSRPCYRTENRRVFLAVDLLDRGPLAMDVVRLAPARSWLELRGGPAAAEVLVDGESRGELPLEPLGLCPGEHRLDVRYGGRTVWATVETLVAGQERGVDISPRPNVVLIGAESWPQPLGAFARLSRLDTMPLPQGFDPERADHWRRLGLPRDTDLALVVDPGRRAERATWTLYSPILGQVTGLEAPPDVGRPAWYGAAWGFSVADSAVAGPGRVTAVQPGGAASVAGLLPGDRIVAVGGVEVSASGQVLGVLRIASAEAPLEVVWISEADGGRRTAGLVARRTPVLEPRASTHGDRMLRAAWATVDGLTRPEAAPAALANLALLLGQAGRHDQAIQVWRRVRFKARAGIGSGTVQYYLGRELEQLGRESAAADAYREAAASEATVFSDQGPRVAPAARDHLADLGFAQRR